MVRGRPRQFDEKVALTSAMDVFWRNGYENASCDDLLDAMGINCGSMYSTFGDKHALYERAFGLYVESIQLKVFELITASESPLQNVRNLIDFWGEFMAHSDNKGCLVINAMIDIHPDNAAITEESRKLIRNLQSVIEEQLSAAKTNGELNTNSDPDELAAFIMNSACGMSLMSRSGAGKKHIERVTKAAHALLA